MNTWKEFVAQQPLEQTPVGSTIDKTYLVDLSHQGLVGVEGPEAAKFLQGQVTCDLRELVDGATRLGAQCNLKGRMLASFRALQLDEERIYLRMPAALVEKTLASLGKYIVFSKAKLHNRSDSYCRVGLSGPHAEALLMQIIGAVPTALDDWRDMAGNLVIKLGEQRYECWLLPDQAESVWLKLAPACVAASENLWTLLDIRAGLGELRLQTSELFTPQALNYQLVNGISFRKGCYTGQEIIARLHYRGTLKRHMYRFSYRADRPNQLPLPGSDLFNADSKVIGEVVIAAYADNEIIEILAAVADDQREDAFIGLEAPQKLEQLPLPYAIPTEDKS